MVTLNIDSGWASNAVMVTIQGYSANSIEHLPLFIIRTHEHTLLNLIVRSALTNPRLGRSTKRSKTLILAMWGDSSFDVIFALVPFEPILSPRAILRPTSYLCSSLLTRQWFVVWDKQRSFVISTRSWFFSPPFSLLKRSDLTKPCIALMVESQLFLLWSFEPLLGSIGVEDR